MSETEESTVDSSLVEAHMLDRPVANLRDIQYVYGVLSTAAADGDGGEYTVYYSPAEVTDALREEGVSVITTDVTVDSNTLTFDGVSFHENVEDAVGKLGFAKKGAARGADHSLTEQSGQDPGTGDLIRYSKNMIPKWPSKEPVQEVAENHEDGWLIDELQELGEDASVREEIAATIEDEVESTLNGNVFITTRFEWDDETKWPGEIDVLNEAMRRKCSLNMAEKSDFYHRSMGEGVDMVTGEETTLVGAMDDPLNHYLTKQQAGFQGLAHDESAWLSNPIGTDAATYIARSSNVLDDTFLNALNLRVYFLPYVRESLTPDRAETMYEAARAFADGGAKELVTFDAANVDKDEWRYYVVMLEYDQPKLFNFEGVIPALNRTWLYDFAESVADIQDSLLSRDGDNAYFTSFESEDDDTFSFVEVAESGHVSDIAAAIASADFVRTTLPRREEYTDTDFRFTMYKSILAGETVNIEQLLREYTERVSDDERYRMENSDSWSVPRSKIVEQFIQMHSLAENDLLRAGRESQTVLEEGINTTALRNAFMTGDESDNEFMASGESADNESEGPTADERRQDELESFIDGVPALQGDENVERRVAFLAGVAIGAMSHYQSSPKGADVSRTLIDKHPVSRISSRRLQEAITDAIDRNTVYSREEGYGMMYKSYFRPLQEAASQVDYDEMSLSDADIAHHYALGVTYGLTN